MAGEYPVSLPSVTTDIELTTAELQLRFRATVPAEPTAQRQMLPLIQAMADAVADGVTRILGEHEQPISCRAGCAACCRQLVPIGEIEARHLRDVVCALSEPRQSEVRVRFAAARQRLREAGLLEFLFGPERWTDEELTRLAMAYFQLGINCPFLDEERCSIYADRPIVCREFLVTSPAENCSRPTAEAVCRVKLPLRLVTAVARFMPELAPPRFVLPVSLILALDWADEHPDTSPPKTGLEWLREILDRLRAYEEGLTLLDTHGLATSGHGVGQHPT